MTSTRRGELFLRVDRDALGWRRARRPPTPIWRRAPDCGRELQRFRGHRRAVARGRARARAGGVRRSGAGKRRDRRPGRSACSARCFLPWPVKLPVEAAAVVWSRSASSTCIRPHRGPKGGRLESPAPTCRGAARCHAAPSETSIEKKDAPARPGRARISAVNRFERNVRRHQQRRDRQNSPKRRRAGALGGDGGRWQDRSAAGASGRVLETRESPGPAAPESPADALKPGSRRQHPPPCVVRTADVSGAWR